MSGLRAGLLLQSGVCPSGVDGVTHLLNFEFIKAVTCAYATTTGFVVMGLIVYGAIATNIYIRTNSVMIPFVLLLLGGGAVLSQLASVGVAVATLLLLATGAGALTYLYYRLSR